MRRSGLPFFTVAMTMSPQAPAGRRFSLLPHPHTEMTYRFLAPVLSAQFITAPTGRPRDIENFWPDTLARCFLAMTVPCTAGCNQMVLPRAAADNRPYPTCRVPFVGPPQERERCSGAPRPCTAWQRLRGWRRRPWTGALLRQSMLNASQLSNKPCCRERGRSVTCIAEYVHNTADHVPRSPLFCCCDCLHAWLFCNNMILRCEWLFVACLAEHV